MSNDPDAHGGKLGVLTKIGYGAGGFSASMFYINFSFFALLFFTDYVHLDVFVGSVIIAVGALWDAFCGPIIGYLSDKNPSKQGRRRPFIKVTLLPLPLFIWLSFTDFGLAPEFAVVYFIVVALGGYLMQELVDIPYSALGAQMTQSYQERSSLATYRNLFWLVAMILSSYFLALAALCGNVFAQGDQRVGFSLAALFCAVLALLSLGVMLHATRGRDSVYRGQESPRFSLRHQIIAPLRIRAFRNVVVVYLSSMIAQVANNTFIVYFMKYCCNLDELTISNFLVYSCVVGLLGTPLANLLSKRSKRVAWTVMMGFWVLGMLLVFCFWNPATSVLMMAFIGLCIGMGLCVQYQLIWSMIPDCIDINEYQQGVREEGIFFSAAAMIQKLGAAVMVVGLGLALSIVGYDGALAMQPSNVVESLRSLFVGCVVVPLGISIVINLFNPITKRRHDALAQALQAKREGKPHSSQGFEALLTASFQKEPDD